MRGVVLALAAAAAAASKVTIDDEDPRWTFPTGWGTFSKASPCPPGKCAFTPDADRVFGGTWRDSSGPVTTTLNVDAATAISIFTVCPGPLSGGGTYHLNVSFELDDAPAGEYVEKLTGCATTQYNYQIFSKTGLALGPHKLVITNRLPSPEQQTSDLIIDYAVIDDGTDGGDSALPSSTTSQPSASQTSGGGQGQTRDDSSSGSSVPVAAIVVPILVVIALVAVAGFWWWRRRRQRTIDDSLVATPYHDAEPGMRSTSNNAASSEVTQSFAPGPGSASVYSSSVVPTHTPDADSSVLYIARNEQQAHDPQLEAALAIIADRAGRSQNPADVVSPAVAQSRRPEKAVYRPMPAVSTTERSTSSMVTTSDARGGYISPNDAAPPSYMDTVRR